MSTISLLMLSNVFMTFAWYGHLKYGHDWPLWKAILVSWAIALLEYCLAVPANRLGFVQFSGFQLKIIQEVITISVFIVFAIFFLKEKLAWNYSRAVRLPRGRCILRLCVQAPEFIVSISEASQIEGAASHRGRRKCPLPVPKPTVRNHS
jgi:uncharacterized protein